MIVKTLCTLISQELGMNGSNKLGLSEELLASAYYTILSWIMQDQWILKDEDLLKKLFDVVTIGTAMVIYPKKFLHHNFYPPKKFDKLKKILIFFHRLPTTTKLLLPKSSKVLNISFTISSISTTIFHEISLTFPPSHVFKLKKTLSLQILAITVMINRQFCL